MVKLQSWNSATRIGFTIACWSCLLGLTPNGSATDMFLVQSLETIEPTQQIHTEFVHDPLVFMGQRQPGSPQDIQPRPQTEKSGSVLADLYFDDQWTTIGGEAAETLEKTADLIQSQAISTLQIEGYCDTRGNTAYAMALANHRIQAVRTYLLQLGVVSPRLHPINFGMHASPECQKRAQPCSEDHLQLSRMFQLLSMSQPRRGCVVRLHVLKPPLATSNLISMPRTPFHQRIRLASPSSTFSW